MWQNTATRLDRTVQCGGTRLVYAVHQTLPSLAEVGLACETKTIYAHTPLRFLLLLLLLNILPAFLTRRIWEQNYIWAYLLALANTWVVLHNMRTLVSTVLLYNSPTCVTAVPVPVSCSLTRIFFYSRTFVRWSGSVTDSAASWKFKDNGQRFQWYYSMWALHKFFINKKFRDLTRMFQGNDRLD